MVSLLFRALDRSELRVEADDTETIGAVKAKLAALKSSEPALLRLLFKGKHLDDDSATVGSIGYGETDFIVLVVSKPKTAATTPAASTPAPAASTTASSTSAAPAPASSSSPAPADASGAAAAAPPSGDASSALVTGAELETMVANLMEMGFPREECVRALRAAFNNPYRAVDYLMNGIPAGVEIPAAPSRAAPAPSGGDAAPSSAAPPSSAGSATPATGAPAAPTGNLFDMAQQAAQTQTNASPTGAGVFDFLRHHPQFNALRSVVQQNPSLLQPLLQQLGAANPQILQLINQHQQEFIRLLNEPVEPGSAAPLPGMEGGAGGAPGPQYIQVTGEEKAAIDRLQGMGFPRSQVIEAFLACDKNEQLAANYLLEHGRDDAAADMDGDEDAFYGEGDSD